MLSPKHMLLAPMKTILTVRGPRRRDDVWLLAKSANRQLMKPAEVK
jgi:hypothetical protein